MNAPPYDPRPRPEPPPRRRPAPKVSAPRPGWGLIEWVVLSQTLLPALLFVPGVDKVRPLIRVSSYLVGALGWVVVVQQGKSSPASTTFPARPWLIASAVWLGLSLANPYNYSFLAAVGQIMLYVSVLAPAFWGGEALGSPRRLGRVMTLLFLTNASSASVGLAQVFSERFNPPVIPVASNQYEGDNVKIVVAGRKIFRPCGLTDSPGAAAPAGATAALIGLALVLRPIGLIRRAVCAGLAFAGVAVIYYTQIRSILLVMALSFVVFALLLGLQGRVGSALTLALGGGSTIVGSLYWVARRMGNTVFERFGGLTTDLAGSIQQNRGGFVWEALSRTVWENPLGYGLGWWGMVHVMFFNPNRISNVWVEVMISAWVIDGGFPLLIAYGGAVVVAVLHSIRIALTSKDPDVSFWATVVAGQNVSTLALCFSYPAFVSPLGLQFWLLNAALHAAHVQSRASAGRPAAVSASAPPRARRRAPRPWPPGQAAT